MRPVAGLRHITRLRTARRRAPHRIRAVCRVVSCIHHAPRRIRLARQRSRQIVSVLKRVVLGIQGNLALRDASQSVVLRIQRIGVAIALFRQAPDPVESQLKLIAGVLSEYVFPVSRFSASYV